MRIDLCDWCGGVKEQGEGATIRIYEHIPKEQSTHRLWGKGYVICHGCLLDIKRKFE